MLYRGFLGVMFVVETPTTRSLLARTIAAPAQHGRFLNTLSLLEHMGSHKIMATQHRADIDRERAGEHEQGKALGIIQSGASLARAVGPFLAAVLIDSAVPHMGADGVSHFMSNHSLFVTFWTASAIMLLAFLLAFYFLRAYAGQYRQTEVAEA